MTTITPNALCFGDEFPAAGAPCLVQVEGHGLTVTVASDTTDGQPESVPFSSLTVSAGGLNHDQLVMKWAGQKGDRTLYLLITQISYDLQRRNTSRDDEMLAIVCL